LFSFFCFNCYLTLRNFLVTHPKHLTKTFRQPYQENFLLN
jgi:hypothetical protein